ncbi:lipoprotein insertase outer membrane protein LolB [Stenotrophomonas sp. 24(2023)]|uniref:lipoprotein insertase outer membrane protein LolB n=1 Tax=Stenotrophomonas sp. 24(2023) TaxID=3068324 RepID=UPI0027DFD5DD|nr:lipoprotein insertase outer membrane protein LolB [Stenotrophomonas sp. 24(2023)]WMJ67934.1 lipoprotein insertase outer membrane protein LolB [Stenotrophomonas sp. 24(2023)]
MTFSLIRPLLLAAVTVLVAACTSVGTQKTPAPEVVYTVSPAAERAEEARVQALRAQPDWSFQGRVAVSKGSNGGSGRIDWAQQGSGYRIQLSAPVTRQSWTLQGDAAQGGGRLDGLGNGPREGSDARQLLLEATGWDIPVNELPDWTRGLVLRGSGDSGVERDAEGRPRRMRQAGWVVQYLEWYPAADGTPALPRRIEASRDDAKVRLLVDQWGQDTP